MTTTQTQKKYETLEFHSFLERATTGDWPDRCFWGREDLSCFKKALMEWADDFPDDEKISGIVTLLISESDLKER